MAKSIVQLTVKTFIAVATGLSLNYYQATVLPNFNVRTGTGNSSWHGRWQETSQFGKRRLGRARHNYGVICNMGCSLEDVMTTMNSACHL